MTPPLTPYERVARAREKKAAQGGRLVQAWIDADDVAGLESAKESGMSVAAILRLGIKSAAARDRRRRSRQA